MACTAPVLRVLLDCPTSRLETPAASTTCHDPAAPEYDDSPSNEGILECPEPACTSRRLPQPRRSFSLPAALPAGKARMPPSRPMRRAERLRLNAYGRQPRVWGRGGAAPVNTG